MAKNEKSNKKEVSKNKKSFMKDFKAELKKVIWPTPKQLINNTVAVITIVLITAVIVFVLDITFESVNKHGIDKIKEAVTSLENTTEEGNTTAENTTAEENTTTENTTTDTAGDAVEITDEGNTSAEVTATDNTVAAE